MNKRKFFPELTMVLVIAALIIIFVAVFGAASWLICVIAGVLHIPKWIPFVVIYLLAGVIELIGDFTTEKKDGKKQ